MASTLAASSLGATPVQRLVTIGALGGAAIVGWVRLAGEMDPAPDAWMFLSMWLSTVGAMMLPTIEPMVGTFWALTRPLPWVLRGSRVGAFVLPYLALWGGAGLLALAVQELTAGRPLLVAALIGAAGLYQIGALKHACLRSCRSPLAFFLQHGARCASTLGTLGVGLRHAALCVGCCSGLMVAFTGAGSLDLTWMVALAGLMLLEKVHPQGATLARWSGLLLLGGAGSLLWRPAMDVLGNPAAGVGALALLTLSALALRPHGAPAGGGRPGEVLAG